MPQQPNELNRQVTLNAGDSLSAIAHRYLGNSAQWRELADINSLEIFEQLSTGQQISIPSREQLEQMAQEQITRLTGQLGDLSNQEQIQRLLEQGISAANLPQLDLSSLRDSTSGQLPWQLISWIL